ncbi:MAG: hypothetical protein ACP5JJ_07125 [Anaerolineae bacterium]
MDQQSQPAVTVTPQAEPCSEAEGALPRYTSFILRCRTAADGLVLARLFEVRSGRASTLTDLDQLPAQVRQWMAEQEAE